MATHMERKSQFRTLKAAHFFDLAINEGKRQVKVSACDQRLVIQCLFDHLGDNKECWPSQLSISVWCGYISPAQLDQYRESGKTPSLNRVKRILRALEENCYIQVNRRSLGAGQGRRTQNVYSIIWSNIKGLVSMQTDLEFDDQSPMESYQSPMESYQSPMESYQSPMESYQSPMESYQSPMESYQSPMAQISKSHPWDAETPPETPIETPIRNSMDSGEDNFDSLRDRYKSQLENAVQIDRYTDELINKLGITQKADISQLQTLLIESDMADIRQAVEQAGQYWEQKAIPRGHRRLKALLIIHTRISEERVCK